ncbi:MAG: hypothetical protein OYM47_07635 [Gemmatimonadota bacterium]|nr:hypothetical protein [Gemmatimonadota bacterium]
MIGKIFSADNIRMAVFLFTLIGAMWTLTNRLEDKMDARFDKIETRLDRIDTRLDSFGERIAKNEARLDVSE